MPYRLQEWPASVAHHLVARLQRRLRSALLDCEQPPRPICDLPAEQHVTRHPPRRKSWKRGVLRRILRPVGSKFRSMGNQCFTVDHDVLGSIRPLLARDAELTGHSQHFLHPQKRHTDPTSLIDDLFNRRLLIELDRSSRDAARPLAKHGPTSISMPRMLSEVPTLVGRGMMQPTKGETLNRL